MQGTEYKFFLNFRIRVAIWHRGEKLLNPPLTDGLDAWNIVFTRDAEPRFFV